MYNGPTVTLVTIRQELNPCHPFGHLSDFPSFYPEYSNFTYDGPEEPGPRSTDDKTGPH